MSGKYVGAVRQFYDGILDRSPHIDDRSLTTDTPLFPNALSVDGAEWPPPFAEYTGEVYSNMAIQGPLLRGLASLSRLTGETRYRRAADESLRFLITRYQFPQTGLLPWGGHVALDLTTGLASGMDCPGMWAQHELKAHQPPFGMMWDVDAAGTRRFIEGFWREHVRDDGSYMFSRHGDLAGAMSGWFWEHLVRGNDGCQFMTSALDLATCAALMWEKTGRRGWLDRALGMIANFEESRDPATGLGATSFTRGSRPAVLERHCLSRYTKCASIGLRLGERIGEEGEFFIRTALNDLLAFGRHGYDEEDNGFFMRRWLGDGSRIDRVGRKPLDLSGYGARGTNDTRNPGLPGLLYSYALAWRLTGETALRPTIDRLLQHLGFDDDFDFALQGSEGSAYILQALLELSDADEDRRWLDLAHAVAETSVARFTGDQGHFFDWPDSSLCRLGQRLPLALLRLDAVDQGREDLVDPDPGGGTYLDPNPKIRWRFDRHAYQLGTPRCACVVGDRYPHGGAADGVWDRAGIQSLSLAAAPGNLFEAGLGGLVIEPLADITPNCTFELLSPRTLLLENTKELCGESGRDVPALISAAYSLSDDQTLDLDIQVQALLVEGEDELVIRCDSALARDAAVEEAPEGPGVAVRQRNLRAVIMAHPGTKARLARPESNRVVFEWRVPVTTGSVHRLRLRVVLAAETIYLAAECRRFAQEPPLDVARMRREAVATAQMVTTT